jgi:antitoxin CcdA
MEATLTREPTPQVERGLAEGWAAIKAPQWFDEYRAAMGAWNGYVEQNGLPLAEFRQF